MNELGLQVGKEEFEKLFQELDTNSDKVISFGDFLRCRLPSLLSSHPENTALISLLSFPPYGLQWAEVDPAVHPHHLLFGRSARQTAAESSHSAEGGTACR